MRPAAFSSCSCFCPLKTSLIGPARYCHLRWQPLDNLPERCEPIGKNRDVEAPQGGIWTARREMKPAGVNRRCDVRALLANPQIFRGRFAPVLHLFVAHFSTLIEVAQAGFFHGRDVHKHVLAAVVGLDKSKSL